MTGLPKILKSLNIKTGTKYFLTLTFSFLPSGIRKNMYRMQNLKAPQNMFNKMPFYNFPDESCRIAQQYRTRKQPFMPVTSDCTNLHCIDMILCCFWGLRKQEVTSSVLHDTVPQVEKQRQTVQQNNRETWTVDGKCYYTTSIMWTLGFSTEKRKRSRWGRWLKNKKMKCVCEVCENERRTRVPTYLPAAMGDFLSSRSWMAVLANTTLLFSDPVPHVRKKSTHAQIHIGVHVRVIS